MAVCKSKGRLLGMVLGSVLLSACGQLPFLGPKHDYKIEGVTTDSLKSSLEEVINNEYATKLDAESPAERLRQERYRERTIREDLLKMMKAKGYYEAEIDFQDAEAEATGTYNITPGPRYTLGNIRIQPQEYDVYLGMSGLNEGEAAEATRVLEEQVKLERNIARDHCYFTLEIRHRAVLRPEDDKVDVTYYVNAGDPAEFGPVDFTGMETVKESHLQKHIPWNEGDCFRRERIEKLRTDLLGSGLLSRAETDLPEAPGPDGTVPMTIDVKERKHRTIRLGLSYYTDEGPGAVAGWTHRNLFGGAEKLDAEARVSAIEQSLNFDFTKPYFLRRDQTLTANARTARENTDAFESNSITAGTSLQRSLNNNLTGNIGTRYTLSSITEEAGDEDTYALLSFPAGLTFDNRNDELNPTQGWLLSGTLEPFYDTLGVSDPFLKAKFGARTYFALDAEADTVLAVRAGLGSITGAATENIPANERFYAGGGGSVRGFGFQEVGPFEDNDPVGGRSLAEVSGEVRFKVSENIGAVTFVDAGSVSDEAFPTFDNPAVGAGVGVRYYSDFGPLRFDIATPVSGDENTDQNYQFYISIGQAF